MAEQDWSTKYLYEQAKELADRMNRPLSIDHFWKIADRDLTGSTEVNEKIIAWAPPTIPELAARARNYILFDMTMAKYGTPGDPDIDASLKRIEILKKCPKDDKGLVQFMCRTNLMFLSREIFNKVFTFTTHARVCNFFVQKNPNASLHKQDETKERLLLYPRGSFKSTADVIDCVQWIINFPDIRILILAAAGDLATAFIGELKNYFSIALGAEFTNFQSLFPEFTISANKEGKEDEFICPCRTKGDSKKKEPTAWSSSILSNLPGWHCDLAKIDDAVNDKNSETPTLVGKVINKVNYADSLIDPGGYKELLGTPYASADLYAFTVESSENPADLKVLSKPCRWLKPESIHKDEKDCGPADFELLFEFDKTGRECLSYNFLQKKAKKYPEIFSSQYMLNPGGVKKIKFPLDLLMRQTISWEQVPAKLVYYIIWDFAYAANASNDYSVGAVIGVDEQSRVYVVDIIRDRFLDSDLAKAIATSYKQHSPRIVPIENSNGAQFLESSIRRAAEEIGISYIPLDFFKCDRTENAKARRIGALQPRLVNGTLFFLNTIACKEDLYKEFKDFGSSSHDDIPDAISHVHRVMPMETPAPTTAQGVAVKEQMEKFDKALREKDFYDMLHGMGDYEPVQPVAPISPEPDYIQQSDVYDPFAIPGMK